MTDTQIPVSFIRDNIKIKSGNLHWVHWCVIVASFLLTLIAWYISKTILEEKHAAAFDREATRVIELINERMAKYEDALWSGVAAIYTHDKTLAPASWQQFTETLNIESKYPGVNGMGIIYHVAPESLDDFLKQQRQTRPDFRIHPQHNKNEYWPITHIEPIATNFKAVGLDMAHEHNRYTAASIARNTGKSQITAPIVLVQDKEKTPGFLFFTPFYKTYSDSNSSTRQKDFVGLVYAPFIMKKLMDGTLEKEKRFVGLKISDSNDVLYNEHVITEPDYDPTPLHSHRETLSIYGRPWQFDLRSTLDFRAASQSHQPFAILISGIIIDILLFVLFTTLARTNSNQAIALKEAEKRYQLYLYAGGDGYWDWYIQQNYEYLSPSFWQMLGYSPEENLPDTWQEVIFKEDLAIVLENFEKHTTSRGEQPFEQELRFQHKDGSTVIVLCRGRVIEWDKNQSPVRMVGTHTDITALKHIEQKLLEAKERYDLAVRGSGVGLWDWDIQNNTLYWSDRFKELIGIRDPLFKPDFESFSQRLHPDDKEKTLEAVNRHLNDAQSYNIEYRLRHNDGHYIWTQARGQALWNHEGKPTRMAGSIADITLAKSNALALKQTLDFQKLLLNVNTDLIFVKDKNFRIVEANPAFINLYPKEKQASVIGSTTIEDFNEQQARDFLAADQKAFAEGESEALEAIDFPDGIRRTLLTKKIRFENLDKETFIIGISRDITELKATEEALIDANAELEEFAYRTSHDLRSPLISSTKLLDIIRDQVEKGNTAKSVEYINIVQDSIKKLERLVSDILTLTRLKHTEVTESSISIAEEVQNSLTKIAHIDDYERVNFLFNYDFNQPINAQKEQLTLVLDNLLSNAIKYQDKNEAVSRVEISTHQANDLVILSISDNGLGIPKRSQKNVFEMFKRFHPNTAIGSGLGLYMVKKSVMKMGGEIEYQDNTKGSTFILKLPINGQSQLKGP